MCDFDTLDQDGNSGWMLVASFAEGYRWGGDGQNILTTETILILMDQIIILHHLISMICQSLNLE